MRGIVFLSVVLLFSAFGLRAAEVEVHPKQSPTKPLPEYRPALPGSGPDSIINRIDTKELINKGQKDAIIMFSCSVKKTGEVGWSGTYRGTEDTKMLEEEVLKRLANAKFVPAVFDHQPVEVIFYGTVVFANIKGKPRLRIFCNQELEELKKETDFVAPQPVSGHASAFTGFHYPAKEVPVVMDGTVQVTLEVDAVGQYHTAAVTSEEPPFIGFGEAALMDLEAARYVPAFRAGKPVASATTITIFYKAEG